MLVGSIEQGEQWIRAGAKIICYASEVEILRRGIMEAATRLHAIRPYRAAGSCRLYGKNSWECEERQTRFMRPTHTAG